MPQGFAVQTRHLAKSYQAGDQVLQVLKGVDLDIRQGEFVSIMGPSGSGKSTLLNLVGLLDVPTSGAIRLMGTETHHMTGVQRALMRRKALGFVFQSFNLMPRLNALHNVMLPMALAGVPRRERVPRAKTLLQSVGLGDRTTHRPAQLSGGQKQRVAIARALALDPPILLADEPTGNLDSSTSGDVMDLFVRLNQAGKTILQVTHDEEMADFGTRTIRFRDGIIVAQERKPVAPFEEPSFFLAPPRPRAIGEGARLVRDGPKPTLPPPDGRPQRPGQAERSPPSSRPSPPPSPSPPASPGQPTAQRRRKGEA